MWHVLGIAALKRSMALRNLVRTIVGLGTIGLFLLSVLESPTQAAIGGFLVIKEIGLAQTGTTGYVLVGGNALTQPCSASPGSPTSGFAFDYSTTKGKTILQMLTAAHLAGKRVFIMGDGTCLTISRPMQPSIVVDSITFFTLQE